MKGKKEKEFIKCYEKYFDGIYRFCYLRVFDRDLSKDLAQETFIKTWKYIISGKEIKNMKAFLYQTARNLIIDNFRKKKVLPLDNVKENAASIRLNSSEEEFLNKMEGEEIKEVLKQLDENHREVIIMRYIEDMKPKEIAQALEESANTVSVRIHNATIKLRKFLKEKYDRK